MKPKGSRQDDFEDIRRHGDPRLSDDDRKILRDLARGPDLANELAALAAHDPDLAGSAGDEFSCR